MRLWRTRRRLTRGLRRLQRWNRRARKLLRQLPQPPQPYREAKVPMPEELMGTTPLKLKVGTALQMRLLLEDWILLLEQVTAKVNGILDALSRKHSE